MEREIKIVKILVACISVLLIISLLLWLWLGNPFTTQSINNVERIVILFDPNVGGDLRTVYITEQSEIEYLYGLLRETTVTRVNAWPSHMSSLQHNSAFKIHIEYQDGQTDQLCAPENGGWGYIHRFLDTRGIDGDPGFIWGRNHNLWEHVRSLDPAAH